MRGTSDDDARVVTGEAGKTGGDDFLIVALVASAGGIKAFKEFFEHVPATSGMAYVVILHLSPEYESRLAQVLQTSSAIPVAQVRGSVKLEPNHVYVIPPNKSLSVLDGHLLLSEIKGHEERVAPVDIFFRTLAETVGSRAVSVVLSGTGTDGSMGMKRIKEMGGISLAQDPCEAGYSDMPRNSIATGLVDYVLPVAEIPAKIIAYKENLKKARIRSESVERPDGDEHALRESNERIARELEDTTQLQRISSLLIEEGNAEVLYEQILDAAMTIMGADFGSIQMLSEDKSLHLLAWRNLHPESVEFWRDVSDETGTACGLDLQHGGRVVVPDLKASELPLNLKYYELSGIAALQSTPLITREGRLIGMISTHWRKVHTPGERELRLLDILARQAADFFERARSEERLRASEEKYRTLFETIDEGFCIMELVLDERGRIADMIYREANPAFGSHSGLRDVVGKRASELFPHLEQHWLDAITRVHQTGIPERMEGYNADLNRWFTLQYSRVGGAGSPFVAAVFNDITERQQREHQQEFLLKLGDALRPLSDAKEIEATACRVLGE